jgi:hypothetical protein
MTSQINLYRQIVEGNRFQILPRDDRRLIEIISGGQCFPLFPTSVWLLKSTPSKPLDPPLSIQML